MIDLSEKDKNRFLSMIEKTPDGCWLWTGRTKSKGYAQILVNGKFIYTHRLSYALFKGELKDGLVIDHLCRVRHCVNPDHLELVTTKENNLRGISFSAVNAKKTACPKGHPYTSTNYRTCHNQRICPVCKLVSDREKSRRYRERLKIKLSQTF